MKKTAAAQYYQLKVTLRGSKPAIWRRLVVASDTALAALHPILQIAMGWGDEHLHEFQHGSRRYGLPDEEYDSGVLNEFDYSLDELLKREGASLTYLYDFGDDWEHQVELEKITPRREADAPPMCTGGARACPPEDIGGIHGYARALKILSKPAHEEYEDLLDWLGEDFDPKFFDKETVNEELRIFHNRQRLTFRFIDMMEELEWVGDEPPGEAEQRLIAHYFPVGSTVADRLPNYDSLQGYLTAIIAAPLPVMPVEWMLGLCEEYRLEFPQEEEIAPLMHALLKLHNQLAVALAEGRPILPEREDLSAASPGTTTMELWSDGFLRGIVHNEEQWFDIDVDEALDEVESCLSLISALARRELEDRELSSEEFNARMALVQGFLPKTVLTLYDMARSEHYAHLSEPDDWFEPPQPATSIKIGRNDPCPCGSGLKYKKCCIGKVVPLH